MRRIHLRQRWTLEDCHGQLEPGIEISNILVVEDDPAVGKALVTLLGILGLAAVLALDGRRALELLAREPGRFWLSLVDLHLPGLNGLQVMARIRELCPKCLVVLVSGCDWPAVLAKFPDAHPDGYLQKPFHFKALAAEIRRLQGLRD